MALDHQDIDLLMEGLESIERASSTNDALSDVMGAILIGKDPDAQEAYRKEREADRRKKSADRRRKQEDVYMLRAKLVGIRRELDSDVAERIVRDASVK